MMTSKKITFLGAGRLAQTLAFLVSKKSSYLLGDIYSPHSSKKTCEWIGGGTPISDLKYLSPADIYFITTPDDEIKKVCEALYEEKKLNPDNIVLHCSGVLSHEILASAKEAGCFTASIHPMKSFSAPATAVQSFPGTYCAYEGDEKAYEEIAHLFRELGAIVFPISSQEKPLYHAASVFASNYLVTLYQVANSLFKQCKIDSAIAKKLTETLMESTLKNLSHHETPKEALTGPLQRGDISTLETHLHALQPYGLQKLYALLGNHTLSLTNLSAEEKEIIMNLFLT